MGDCGIPYILFSFPREVISHIPDACNLDIQGRPMSDKRAKSSSSNLNL